MHPSQKPGTGAVVTARAETSTCLASRGAGSQGPYLQVPECELHLSKHVRYQWFESGSTKHAQTIVEGIATPPRANARPFRAHHLCERPYCLETDSKRLPYMRQTVLILTLAAEIHDVRSAGCEVLFKTTSFLGCCMSTFSCMSEGINAKGPSAVLLLA